MQELKLSSNTAKLHQMFGKKLYASKFSFISEICQNAVDSHRMAGVKEPVIVGIDGNGSINKFYVKDVGLSFKDKDDFVSKVCTILESGKSDKKDNSEDCPMGEHGIGSISVSAYQSKWKYTVVTPDKRKFTCTLEEVEGKGLMYNLSGYTKTDEEKGVLFEVNMHPYGLRELIMGMREKLRYFKDIQFKFTDDIIKTDKTLLTLNTDFKLFQSEDFQISTLYHMNASADMHISLDQYSYAIRWDILGIPPIQVGVALKFSMGDGLQADITRENLTHTDNYKKIIMEKIERVAEWFVNKYNETLDKEETSLIRVISSLKMTKCVQINGLFYQIPFLARYAKTLPKEPRFKGVSDRVLNLFISKTEGGKLLFRHAYNISKKGSKLDMGSSTWQRFMQSEHYLADIVITPLMWRYLKTKPNIGIYTKRKISLSKGECSYKYFLNLPSAETSKEKYKETGINPWRKPIEEFKLLERAAELEYFTLCSKVVIPDEMKIRKKTIAIRKNKVDIDNMEGEIGVKYAEPLLKSSVEGFNCKFTEKTIQVRDLHKQPHLHVYGEESDRSKLDLIYLITCWTGRYKKTNSVIPCIVSKTALTHLNKLKLHNFMSVEDFFKGEHRVFREIITSYIIYTDILTKYSDTVKCKDIIKKYLSEQFADDLDKLEQYYKRYTSYALNNFRGDEKLITDLLQIAKDGNLYDHEMWGIYNKVKDEIDNFDFVNFFTVPLSLSHKHEAAKTAMEDIAKQRKIRMNWKNYTIFDFKEKK